MIDLTSLIKLAKDLSLIQQVRWKLLRQNEPAAEKLAEVLDELSKMVSALDEKIVRYLSLAFNDETVVSGRSVQVRDARVQLTETMSSLRAMQAEFIAVAKTI